MSEYEHSLSVQVPPDQLFEFVSDVRNLPKYLPTVQDATRQSGERIRVKGEAAGHKYDDDGFFRVDAGRRRMEWGSDGDNHYSGWLEVAEDAGKSASQVTVHLSFEPSPELARQFEQQGGDRDRDIREGMEKTLVSIKNICEGRGGKVEPRSAKS